MVGLLARTVGHLRPGETAACSQPACNSRAKAGWGEASCSPLVLVAAVEPERPRAALIASDRSTVQQGVVTHGRLEPAPGGRVGAVDHAVRELVRAQPGLLGEVPGRIGCARLRILRDGLRQLALEERPQILLRVDEAEVAVEV